MTRTLAPKQTADGHSKRQPWAYKLEGKGVEIKAFWLFFSSDCSDSASMKRFDTESHTSAVPLPPRSACWNPASTCNLLTLLLSRVSWAHQAYQCDREQGGKKEQNWEMLSLQRKVFPSQSSFWQLTYKLLPAWLA